MMACTRDFLLPSTTASPDCTTVSSLCTSSTRWYLFDGEKAYPDYRANQGWLVRGIAAQVGSNKYEQPCTNPPYSSNCPIGGQAIGDPVRFGPSSATTQMIHVGTISVPSAGIDMRFVLRYIYIERERMIYICVCH
jgi:hypothetical protein